MNLTLNNLSKHFGAVKAVDDISLSIPSGELVALLGPSGSGKTTLLRIVGGLEAADCGQVLYAGEDTTRWPIQKRRAGFVFQNYALFRNMTVFENIAFGLRAQPRKQRPNAVELKRRVAELLYLIRLPDLAERYPSQLSGGQQQRVALARALAIEPRLLLLDEPFGALDAQVRKELRRWVRQVHDQTGLTTLFVTHDQDEALELADRVVVMREGRIEQIGTPDEIFEAPATRFVHEFVGESSALPVDVRGGRVSYGGQQLDIDAQLADGPAHLLLRPQHLAPADTGIVVRVDAARRVGPRRRIEAVTSAGDRLECEVDSRFETERGQTLHLQPTRWRLYSRDTAGSPLT